MEIFSSWIFWVVVATIVFVLALIGFLTESLKKSKKEDKEEKIEPVKVEPLVTEDNSTTVVNDDWMNMPKTETLDEAKVEPAQDLTSVDTLNTNTLDNSNMNDTVVVPSAVTPDVDTLNVEENAPVSPVSQTPLEPKAEEKNDDIWNL